MEATLNNFSAVLLEGVEFVNNYLSNYILTILLVGIGIFFTFKTRFVQVRCFGEGMKQVFGKFSMRGGKQSGGISSFQALTTAIAAQVGTGNIVGACSAILVGGPGAIFWMWIIAAFGMSTIYAEAVLAQETKITDKNGETQGGPVYYIRTAFKGRFGKFLAGFFAVAIILAVGFIGCMVQSNAISSAVSTAVNTTVGNGFSMPNWIIGLILAAVSGFIFIGGVNRIASVTEKLVPVMAILYIVGCLVVLACKIQYIPQTFLMIIQYAFTPKAILGGGIGSAIMLAIQQGVKRGLFSNEAGMGSTPHAHAMAKVDNPHQQGVVAMVGVFIDTFVVLTLTALVVIATLFTGENGLAAVATAAVGNGNATLESIAKDMGIESTNMVQVAFTKILGDVPGTIFVAVCLLFFAFSTIIGWNLFGKINAQYLFGKKATVVYSIIAIVFIFIGACIQESKLVWGLSDMFNNLMVIPNVIALAFLSKIVCDWANKGKEKLLSQNNR